MNLREEIEKMAYELYEKSGRAAGRDIENWLEAEKKVMARVGQGVSTAAKQVEKTALTAAKTVKRAVKKVI